MPRNLDITALRSFAAVADAGGVTRAASALHLTQSAVSMQLKRLEQSLGVSLIDRSGRGVALSSRAVVATLRAEGDLEITRARLVLEEIELETDDDDSSGNDASDDDSNGTEYEAGPILLELNLSGCW